MLIHIYTTIALLIFFILIISGSDIESAMIRSAVLFSVLVILTKITKFVILIIKKSPPAKNEAETSAQ